MSNVPSTSRSLLTLNGAMVESSWFLISLVDKITVGVGCGMATGMAVDVSRSQLPTMELRL